MLALYKVFEQARMRQRYVTRLPRLRIFLALIALGWLTACGGTNAINGPTCDALETSGLSVTTEDTLRAISGFLPPSGRVALALDAAGRLVGCGMMRTCAPGAVELKRLFVLPECQGSGRGRRRVDARLEEARGMGMTHAYADAFKNNIPMQKLYETLGFEPCERYEGIDEYDELTEFMIYRRLTL